MQARLGGWVEGQMNESKNTCEECPCCNVHPENTDHRRCPRPVKMENRYHLPLFFPYLNSIQLQGTISTILVATVTRESPHLITLHSSSCARTREANPRRMLAGPCISRPLSSVKSSSGKSDLHRLYRLQCHSDVKAQRLQEPRHGIKHLSEHLPTEHPPTLL